MGPLDAILVILLFCISLTVVKDLMSTYRVRMNRIKREERVKCENNVVLYPDQVYLFKSNALGNFRIRGYFTGNITIDGYKVAIWDAKRTYLYFQCGSTNDRVELKDVDGITTVKLIPNGARKLNRPTEDAVFKYQFKHNEIQVNQDLSSDDYENPGPLQIVGYPDKQTIIAGHRPALVTGNGGYLKKLGTSTVTVRGNLQRVVQEGTSTVNVHGNVMGLVSGIGFGSIHIEGDVHGTVTADGMGSIIIKGNVHGDIRSKGYGSVEVLGRHLNGGQVITEGFGHVSVDGADTTSFVSKLFRFV